MLSGPSDAPPPPYGGGGLQGVGDYKGRGGGGAKVLPLYQLIAEILVSLTFRANAVEKSHQP